MKHVSVCISWDEWWNRDNSPATGDVGDNGSWVDFDNVRVYSSPNDFDECVFFDEISGCMVVGAVKLFNGADLSAQLGSCNNNHLAIVLKSYLKWGEDCVRHLEGEFSFIIWNRYNKALLCYRDQLGFVPFYYHAGKRVFLFSTHLSWLSKFSFSFEFDEVWLLDHVQGLNSFNDRTVYKYIKKLPAGYYARSTGGSMSYKSYWNLDVHSIVSDNEDNYIEHFRSLLEGAVEKRIRGFDAVNLELSGGIDSCLVAATASGLVRKSNSKLVAFTNVLPAKYKGVFDDFGDEWQKAAVVCRTLGINKHIPVDRPPFETVDLYDKMLDILASPTRFIFTIQQTGIYQSVKQNGAGILLSGFGGDEAVSQRVFARYPYSLIKQKSISRYIQFYKRGGDSSSRAGLKVAYHYLRYMMGGERSLYNGIRRLHWNNVLIHDELKTNNIIRRSFFDSIYFPDNQSIRERMQYSITNPWLTERLETGYMMNAAYGLYYTYPLLDLPLLEYYFRIPDRVKIGDCRHDRWFSRMMLQGSLPESIVMQDKPTNTYTIPFAKVEARESGGILLDILLQSDRNHKVFDYVDRNKIEAISREREVSDYGYENLQLAFMLLQFYNKRQSIKLNEI